jgi:hypothetical protein
MIGLEKSDGQCARGSNHNAVFFKKSVKPEIRHLLSDSESFTRKESYLQHRFQFTDNPAQEEGPVTLPRFTELLEHDAIPFNTLFWISDYVKDNGDQCPRQSTTGWRARSATARTSLHGTGASPVQRAQKSPDEAFPLPRHPPAFAHTDDRMRRRRPLTSALMWTLETLVWTPSISLVHAAVGGGGQQRLLSLSWMVFGVCHDVGQPRHATADRRPWTVVAAQMKVNTAGGACCRSPPRLPMVFPGAIARAGRCRRDGTGPGPAGG